MGDLIMNVNFQQQQAAIVSSKNALILAGPGTGCRRADHQYC